MFIHARFASRSILTSLTRARVGPTLVPRLSPQNLILTTTAPSWTATRSFLTSARVNDPAETKTTKTRAKKADGETAKKPKKRAVKKPIVKKKAPKIVAKKPLVVKPSMLPPKSPLAPYLRFFQSFLTERPKPVSLEGMNALSVECAEAWRGLSESEKQPFRDAFAADRIEYAKRRTEWFDNVDPAVLRAINKRRIVKGRRRLLKPRDPDAPKRPTTSFLLFVKDNRDAVDSSLKVTDQARKMGEAWNALPTEEKQRYEKIAADARAEFKANNSKPTDE